VQRRAQSKEAGATDFWVKPFKPTSLVKDIAKVIDAHQAATDSRP
jgi:FixJ family two-component response regulator